MFVKHTYAPTQVTVTYFYPSGVVLPKVNLHMKFDDQVTYSSREIDLNAKSNQGVTYGRMDRQTDGQPDGPLCGRGIIITLSHLSVKLIQLNLSSLIQV